MIEFTIHRRLAQPRWLSVVVPIGKRTGDVQVTPSLELLITMSLPVQFARKRQSCQTT